MKDNRVYLIHIRDCIQRIETYTIEGKEAFFSDIKTQDAVIRNLQTLCESTQRLPDVWKAIRPEIDWRAIGDFRNVLAHQYLGHLYKFRISGRRGAPPALGSR
ncbi:Zn-dependent alcohol dehydrogenase [Gloeomargarita lithophora Alchichica-D10]|uniref:Zn-dependent alcohol dehydrogenase n=1 Tax=Gloeomargarita lithophora Alchichica-D10 TaxID=1188229 RepID=A0A1J0AFB9_9CYAN|nr:HepT-like ribonuclease domain-containing protein [Gloeomargarita lithophora]APB34641.1 Zn-dependent alcohol dehydrogenase [Gloeomargarita lithophora Alchichica-D10]